MLQVSGLDFAWMLFYALEHLDLIRHSAQQNPT